MRRTAILTIGSAVLMIFMLVLAHAQDEMGYIDNSVFEDPMRPPSLFDHDIHNASAGIDNCIDCHHVYEDGVRLENEVSIGLRCSDCHDLKKVGNTPGLMNAYHLNCKGCHKENSAGPIMCGECHVEDGIAFINILADTLS